MLGRMSKFAVRKDSIMSKKIKKAGMAFMAMVMSVVVAAGLAGCDDPYYGPEEWYLSGVYANDLNFYETYTFYSNGTGIYEDYYGELPFDYYCLDGSIYFTFYPYDGPAYDLNCGITTSGRNSLIITYPPGNGMGYTSERYTLVGW